MEKSQVLNYVALTVAFFVGVEDAGIKEYEWLTSKPKVVEAGNLIIRHMNETIGRLPIYIYIYIYILQSAFNYYQRLRNQ
jgi:hypothetical protein